VVVVAEAAAVDTKNGGKEETDEAAQEKEVRVCVIVREKERERKKERKRKRENGNGGGCRGSSSTGGGGRRRKEDRSNSAGSKGVCVCVCVCVRENVRGAETEAAVVGAEAAAADYNKGANEETNTRGCLCVYVCVREGECACVREKGRDKCDGSSTSNIMRVGVCV